MDGKQVNASSGLWRSPYIKQACSYWDKFDISKVSLKKELVIAKGCAVDLYKSKLGKTAIITACVSILFGNSFVTSLALSSITITITAFAERYSVRKEEANS